MNTENTTAEATKQVMTQQEVSQPFPNQEIELALSVEKMRLENQLEMARIAAQAQVDAAKIAADANIEIAKINNNK